MLKRLLWAGVLTISLELFLQGNSYPPILADLGKKLEGLETLVTQVIRSL